MGVRRREETKGKRGSAEILEGGESLWIGAGKKGTPVQGTVSTVNAPGITKGKDARLRNADNVLRRYFSTA